MKKNNTYNVNYSSSTITKKGELGSIENDACGNFGKFEIEDFRGKKMFDILINKEFTSILDIGAGEMKATEAFINKNKIVDICDFDNSYYYKKSKIIDKINKKYIGDFNTLKFDKMYDAIWCSHVLEHSLNPNMFLKKIFSLLNEGGYLTIIVPPRKPFIVGGHVSIWNGGLLLYHLVLANFDCSEAQVLQYDYNICIIVKKKTIILPKLNYDIGDLLLLNKFFPIDIKEDSFNGDIMNLNV